MLVGDKGEEAWLTVANKRLLPQSMKVPVQVPSAWQVMVCVRENETPSLTPSGFTARPVLHVAVLVSAIFCPTVTMSASVSVVVIGGQVIAAYKHN